MVDWIVMLDPIYDVIGVEAQIVTAPGVPLETVTVIDKTDGIDAALVGGDISVQSIVPAAAVRVRELAEKDIDLADLLDGAITFNGATWTIKSHRPKPTPGGEADGELYLILEKSDC